ncbi:MAG: DPP IV N-terminal domain-containing protein, partial [Gemmatimonadaceae bacterium]
MQRPRFRAVALSFAPLLTAAMVAQSAPLLAQTKATEEQFLSPASPLMLATAKRADRVAWMTYDRGMRNVFTAAAPAFTPVRLTNFMKDDGTDLSDVALSDDGSIIVFVRGLAPNRFGWVANPSQDPDGSERAIWAVRAAGGAPWRVAVGSAPELSPDGRWVLYVKDGQVYRARVARGATASAMDTGGIPFIKEWGRNSAPIWSPDGQKIAFVSARENHAFIAVYDMAARKLKYLSPSVDCDGTPTWSPDSKRIAFSRRPGTPFGLQAQTGTGGIGNPAGPAVNATASAAASAAGATIYNASCGGGGFGGRGGGGGAAPGGGRGAGGANQEAPGRMALRSSPGFYTSAFPGGHNLRLMIADATTGDAKEVWHKAPRDSIFTSFNNMRWANNEVVFPVTVPHDEFERWYSLNVNGGTPVRLTTTNGIIEDNTSVAISSDGKTFFYVTNSDDIERRHVYAVPTVGGTPRKISMGNGIETYVRPLGSGKNVAVIYMDEKTPASIGI